MYVVMFCPLLHVLTVHLDNRRDDEPADSVPAPFVAASQLNGGIYANVRSGCLRGCYR
jgi:hypothetical protein